MEILFVDDDEEEAGRFKEAMNSLGENMRVSHITFCPEVLWLLKSKKPDMVFLRVNEERKDGIYFLQSIRALKELGPLPIIMYSTTLNDCYVERCYKGKANYYLQKQDSVMDTVKSFSRFMSSDLKSQKRISKAAFLV